MAYLSPGVLGSVNIIHGSWLFRIGYDDLFRKRQQYRDTAGWYSAESKSYPGSDRFTVRQSNQRQRWRFVDVDLVV